MEFDCFSLRSTMDLSTLRICVSTVVVDLSKRPLNSRETIIANYTSKARRISEKPGLPANTQCRSPQYIASSIYPYDFHSKADIRIERLNFGPHALIVEYNVIYIALDRSSHALSGEEQAEQGYVWQFSTSRDSSSPSRGFIIGQTPALYQEKPTLDGAIIL